MTQNRAITDAIQTNKLVKIYQTYDANQATIIESLLKSEGFSVYLDHLKSNQVFGGVPGLSEGVFVMVPQSEEMDAKNCLIQNGFLFDSEEEQVESIQKHQRQHTKKMWYLLAVLVLILFLLYAWTQMVIA